MPHSLTKIWIHSVFGTKNRESLIISEFEQGLHEHIKEQLERDFGCTVGCINGIENHVHILFLLNPNYSVAEIMKNAKGESSHWWNQNDFTDGKFAWQVGYGAFSVSESDMESVARYIRNQKEHHKKKSFIEEYEEFMKRHGLNHEKETVQNP